MILFANLMKSQKKLASNCQLIKIRLKKKKQLKFLLKNIGHSILNYNADSQCNNPQNAKSFFHRHKAVFYSKYILDIIITLKKLDDERFQILDD